MYDPWPNRTGLAALPHDLLITVYGFLDVPDALALAQTCRVLHAFAVSRAAWLALARTLAVTRALALPSDKQTTTCPAELSTAEMRAAVQHTTRLASNLLRPTPTLVPYLSLALPEDKTVVHATLLPGARFLLTAQHGGTKKMPRWLRRQDSTSEGLDEESSTPPPSKGKGRRRRKRTNQPITLSALGLSVDAEHRSTDVFRGVALGSHDVEPDSESDGSESDSDSTSSTSSSTSRSHSRHPGFQTSTLPTSYSLPTPTQSSLLAPATPPTPSEKQKTKSLPLHRPFRRVCRVRYKRTIFPTHVNYAHELAGIGAFGRYAAWIEGDGAPEEVDWAKEELRVVVAPLVWESGAELRDGGDGEVGERKRAGEMARIVSVPDEGGMRDKLNLVSCVTMEDALGVIAMATIDGRVVVGSLVG
ncbi:hypothetical protein FRC07_010338 [Ceratobasidium sp. 392]|nr:hypothetical protein FRC07_010338 [Ceratobasidium sp. 392]